MKIKTLEQLEISPFPWRQNEGKVWKTVIDGDERTICELMNRSDGHGAGNARFITSAPLMYEALAAMLSSAEKNAPYLDMSHMDIAMDMARKALTEAGGLE